MIKQPVFFALLIGVQPVAALADNNQIFLRQQNVTGSSSGNTISIDQSKALGSLIAGNELGTLPAQQVGSSNQGTVVDQSQASTVLFSQGNASDPATGNIGTINLGLNGSGLFASLSQLGSLNEATINLSGSDNSASINQIGNDLVGAVSVSGSDTSGTLNQTGNGQEFELTVSGDGTNVTYNLLGNNIGAVTGPTVFSNAGTVTVTTTVLGQ